MPSLFVQEGKVGIGTTAPKEVFQIGDRFTIHNGGTKYIGYNTTYNGVDNVKMAHDFSSAIAFSSGNIILQTGPEGPINSNAGLTTRLVIMNDGRVSIGNVPIPAPVLPGRPEYGLYVDKGILASRIKVAVASGAEWFDHVFNEDYKLMPLDSLSNYVKENKHLPDIPSADEVVKEGLDLGTFNALLLKKVEELTLYVMELKLEIEAQKKK